MSRRNLSNVLLNSLRSPGHDQKFSITNASIERERTTMLPNSLLQYKSIISITNEMLTTTEIVDSVKHSVNWKSTKKIKQHYTTDSSILLISLKLFWNSFLILSIVLTLFWEPYSLAFYPVQLKGTFIFSLCIDILFLLDFIFVSVPSICRQRKSGLSFDNLLKPIFEVIGVLPIFFVNSRISCKLTTEELTLTMFRLTRIRKMILIFDNIADFTKVTPRLLSFVSRLCVVFISTHILSCSYWLFSVYSSYGNLCGESEFRYNNLYTYGVWLPPVEVMSRDSDLSHFTVQGYSWSHFYAIMAITGSGRDMKPNTEMEYLFSILSILIGIFGFAYIISGVTALIQDEEQEETQLRHSLRYMNSLFLKNPGVPNVQRYRIKNWFFYKFSRQNVSSSQYTKIFCDLPRPFQLEMKMFCYENIFENSNQFYLLRPMCKLELMKLLHQRLILPDEVIYDCYSEINSIYFLVQGRLRYINELKGSIRAHEAPAILGCEEMLSCKSYSGSLNASSHAEILELQKSEVFYLLNRYPSFFGMLARAIGSKKTSSWAILKQILKVAKSARLLGVHTEFHLENRLTNNAYIGLSTSCITQFQKKFLNTISSTTYQLFFYQQKREHHQLKVKQRIESKAKIVIPSLKRKASFFKAQRQQEHLNSLMH